MWHAVGGLLLLSVLGATRALPDCCALGFGDVDLTPGNDSSVCVSDGQDCCTPAYLNNVVRSDVQNLLETYLMKEFKDGINDSISKFVQFQEYFDDHSFEGDIVHVLASTTSSNAENFEISVRNLTQVLSGRARHSDLCEVVMTNMSNVLVHIVQESFNTLELSDSEVQCIYRTTSERIDEEALAMMSTGLVELFNSTLLAMEKIKNFIMSQKNRTDDARVIPACVNGFITASTCTKCVERTAPLCLVTCNALVRGCYSPYFTVLNGQFVELWKEVDSLARRVNSTVGDIFEHTSKLVDFPKLLSDIESDCGLTVEQGMTPSKEREVGIPSAVLEPLLELNGPFLYGERDLKVCRAKLDEEACNEVTQGPQGLECTPQNDTQLKEGEYTSNPGALTTSECDCFDGVDTTTDDETPLDFDSNDLHDQGDNPAFQPPLDVTVLEEEQCRIEQQGNEVQSFLSSKVYSEYKGGASVCSPDDGKGSTSSPTTASGSVSLASLSALVSALSIAYIGS